MIKNTLLATTLASGLIVPATAGVYLPPKPAIVKPENLEFSKNLLAMPFTLGMLKRRTSAPTPTVAVGTVGSSITDGTSYSLNTTTPNAGAGRILVGAAIFDAGSSVQTNIGTMSHNTVSQTVYKNGTNIYLPTGFFIVSDTSSTTGTMAFTGTSGTNGFSTYFALTGINSATFSDSKHLGNVSITTLSTSVNVPVNGLVLAFAVSSSNNTPNTRTWTGVDEVASAYVNSDATYSVARRHYPSGATGQTVSIVFSQNDRIGLGVLVLSIA